MGTAVRTSREYRTGYKKKSTTADPYRPRGAGKKIAVCSGCQAVFMKKRWYSDGEALKPAAQGTERISTVCPACLKIRDDFPGGIVTLTGSFVLPHKQDVFNLIKNEEERARGFNPLERVMSIRENGHGNIVINTTNEKLAQRLGRALKKAFHGNVTYRWSHDNKLVRVEWVREME
jgi:hypothetical protein